MLGQCVAWDEFELPATNVRVCDAQRRWQERAMPVRLRESKTSGVRVVRACLPDRRMHGSEIERSDVRSMRTGWTSRHHAVRRAACSVHLLVLYRMLSVGLCRSVDKIGVFQVSQIFLPSSGITVHGSETGRSRTRSQSRPIAVVLPTISRGQ